MKKLILMFLPLLAAFALGGCANTPIGNAPTLSSAQSMANLQAMQYRSCVIYTAQATKSVINQKLSTLPPASAQELLIATHQAAALCKTVFTNSNQAASQLSADLTKIGLLTAIHFAN